MIFCEAIDGMWAPHQLVLLALFLLLLTMMASRADKGLMVGMFYALSGLAVVTYSEFVLDDVFYTRAGQEFGSHYC